MELDALAPLEVELLAVGSFLVGTRKQTQNPGRARFNL